MHASFPEDNFYDEVQIQDPRTTTFAIPRHKTLLPNPCEKRNGCIFYIPTRFRILSSPLHSSLPSLIAGYNPRHKSLMQLRTLTNFLRRLGLTTIHWKFWVARILKRSYYKHPKGASTFKDIHKCTFQS